MPSSPTPPVSPSALIIAYYQGLVRGNPWSIPSPTEATSTALDTGSQAGIGSSTQSQPVCSPPPAPRLVPRDFPLESRGTAAVRSRGSEEEVREWRPFPPIPSQISRPTGQERQLQAPASTFLNTSTMDFESFATSPSSIYSPVHEDNSSIPTTMLGLGLHHNRELYPGPQPENDATVSLGTPPARAPPTPPVSVQESALPQSHNMRMRSIATELVLVSMSLNQLSRHIDNVIATPGALPSSAYEAPHTATTTGTGISPRGTAHTGTPHIDRRRFGRGSSVYDDDDAWSFRAWSTRSSRRVRHRLGRRWSRCSGRRDAVSMASGHGLGRFKAPRSPQGL